MQYIEVEKKYALPDPAALKAKLEALGAKPSEPTRQVDAYFNAPHRDFTAPRASSPLRHAPRSSARSGSMPDE